MSEASLVRTAFPQAVIENIGFYVYRLIDPRDNRTFYVGKGTGNRVFQHVAAAADLPDRQTLKLDRIREIEASRGRVRYIIHRHGLTEAEAYLIESALIDAYEDLSNSVLGHGAHRNGLTTVDDLVAFYDSGPADIDVPALLVNLHRQFERGLTPEQLYARTRGYWTCNPRRHPNVGYGMAVALGIIREVYLINSWEKHTVGSIKKSELRRANPTPRKSKERWAFTGRVALDMRDRFVGKTVAWPSQSAFLWRNC